MTGATQQTRTLRRLEESRQKARTVELVETKRMAKLAEGNARLAAQSARAMAEQQVAMDNQLIATQQGATAASPRRGGIRGIGGKLMGASMAMSGIGMGVGMMDNAAGQFAQKLMPAMYALDAITTVMYYFEGAFKKGIMSILSIIRFAGPWVIAIAALTTLVIVGRNRLQDMFDEAVDKGKKMAQSMDNVSKIGDVFGKSFKLLNVKKLGFKTEQKTKTQQYFETEQGSAEIKRLSEQRGTLGREQFSANMAKDVATSAITQGLSGKQIDAYISTVAEKLNDAKLYYDLRGQLVELLDPKNKEDILKNGLLIKVNAEAATDFLKQGMIVPKVNLNQLKADVSALFATATNEGVQQQAISGTDAIAQKIQALESEYTSLANKAAEGDQSAQDRMTKLRMEIIPNLRAEMNTLSASINNNVVEVKDMVTALEKGTQAGATFGQALIYANQFIAQQQGLLSSGAITQKEFNKQMREANAAIISNSTNIKQVAKNLSMLDDGGEALSSFFTQMGDQLFAGLDEELKKNLIETLSSITDIPTKVDLQIAYAQGTITAQGLLDIAKSLEFIPPFVRSDIIVAYGKGSLTLEEVNLLNASADQLVGFDGSQIDFLINVSGAENLKTAMSIMQQINALGTISDSNFMQYSALSNQLSQIPKDIVAEPQGETGGNGDGEGDGDGGGGGSKTKSILQQLIADVEANLKIFPGMLNKIKEKFGKKNLIPQAIIDSLGAGEDGLKNLQELLNMSKEKVKQLIADYTKTTSSQTLVNIKKAGTEKRQQINAQGILERQGFSKEDAKSLSSNTEDALLIINAAAGKTKESLNAVTTALRATLDTADPNEKAISDLNQQIEDTNLAYEQQIKPVNDLISAKQKEIDVVNEQIDAIEKLNVADSRTIRNLERKKEMIQRQIDALQRLNDSDQTRIDSIKREDELRNRVSDALSRELDVMSQQEKSIQDNYNKRIAALDEIAKINSYIVNQQKSQLGLAQALSQGDVYAAAAAQQQMQEESVQFASDQMRTGLQTGMENQVAGLTTSGGLTREQADAQIVAIKEQSYQASLLIRDIEDAIYNRNLEMVPLKKQQYDVDVLIQGVQDDMYARESQIIGLQDTKLSKLTEELSSLTRIKEGMDDVLKKKIDSFEADIDSLKILKDQKDRVDDIAKAWYKVKQQITDANAYAKRQISELGNAPVPSETSGESDEAYQKRVTAWNDRYNTIISARNSTNASALNLGLTATSGIRPGSGQGMLMASGGGVGNQVIGAGGRDSVPAMLTPGEFVMRKASVQKYGMPMLSKMNMGAFDMPRYDTQQPNITSIQPTSNTANINAPVYNTYSVNVSANTNASADDIANTVMTKIKRVDSMAVRSFRGY
jgi:hypothetical protein